MLCRKTICLLSFPVIVVRSAFFEDIWYFWNLNLSSGQKSKKKILNFTNCTTLQIPSSCSTSKLAKRKLKEKQFLICFRITNSVFGLGGRRSPPYDKRIFACPISSTTTLSSEFQTENAQIQNSHHFSTHQLQFFPRPTFRSVFHAILQMTFFMHWYFRCEKSWFILTLKTLKITIYKLKIFWASEVNAYCANIKCSLRLVWKSGVVMHFVIHSSIKFLVTNAAL